jgi:acyl-CoA synthetase (AMP-forming)/AMP-acid ligase II
LIEAAFGMTETQTFDTFTIGLQQDDMDLNARPIFVGLPVPGTRFKVCDFDSFALLPFGEEGEICVQTPSLFKGYWRSPAASATALRGGWLHTGDNGVIDQDGFIHYLGRRKEMLKVNGMSVFPAEIEALLGQHPDVVGSGVIGVPHPERGEQPVAFIRLRAGAVVSEAEMVAWCRANMSGFKVPRVVIVAELPLTATGKVKKNELAALIK